MSHVWGQTVPSNYGRLPATRQKVFHATEDVAKQVIKETIQQVQEKVIAFPLIIWLNQN